MKTVVFRGEHCASLSEFITKSSRVQERRNRVSVLVQYVCRPARDAQQFATAHDVDAEFPVHRARRPTRQHDEARTASTQFNSADHWRINVYYTLLDTVA